MILCLQNPALQEHKQTPELVSAVGFLFLFLIIAQILEPLLARLWTQQTDFTLWELTASWGNRK